MWEKYLKALKPWKASNYAKWFNSTGENVLTITYWYARGASIIQNHKHQTNKQIYQASESIVYNLWVYGNLCKHCDIVTHSSPFFTQPVHRFILPQNGAQIGAPWNIMATWHAVHPGHRAKDWFFSHCKTRNKFWCTKPRSNVHKHLAFWSSSRQGLFLEKEFTAKHWI